MTFEEMKKIVVDTLNCDEDEGEFKITKKSLNLSAIRSREAGKSPSPKMIGIIFKRNISPPIYIRKKG